MQSLERINCVESAAAREDFADDRQQSAGIVLEQRSGGIQSFGNPRPLVQQVSCRGKWGKIDFDALAAELFESFDCLAVGVCNIRIPEEFQTIRVRDAKTEPIALD